MEKALCDIKYESGILSVSIDGEIDHHTAKPLREKIDAAIYLYRAPKVVIRMPNVGFMDSAGLGLILGRYAKVSELGGELTVADPEPGAEKILRLAGADKLIRIEKSGEVLK